MRRDLLCSVLSIINWILAQHALACCIVLDCSKTRVTFQQVLLWSLVTPKATRLSVRQKFRMPNIALRVPEHLAR